MDGTPTGETEMHIKGKVRGEFKVKAIRPQEHFKEAVCLFNVRVDMDKGAKVWGDDFINVAFSGFRQNADGDPSWIHGAIDKPNLTCEIHTVVINGQRLKVQPEIKKILPIEKQPAVTVPLEFRVNMETEELTGKVGYAVGDMVDLEFEPIADQLPGTNANAPSVKVVKGPHGNPKPVLA
jgi:hypothetical protein